MHSWQRSVRTLAMTGRTEQSRAAVLAMLELYHHHWNISGLQLLQSCMLQTLQTGLMQLQGDICLG